MYILFCNIFSVCEHIIALLRNVVFPSDSKIYYSLILFILHAMRCVTLCVTCICLCFAGQLAMGKMMDQGPVLIITFQAQLVMVVRNSKGEVVEGDPVSCPRGALRRIQRGDGA